MRRFTIQLEDQEFEALVEQAAREDRPVAVQAARFVRRALGTLGEAAPPAVSEPEPEPGT